MQRFDFEVDEACTRIKFTPQQEGGWVKYDAAMRHSNEELAYAMDALINTKAELQRVYNLVSHHAGESRKHEDRADRNANLLDDCEELMVIAKEVATTAGRPTLATRLGYVLKRMELK